MIEFLVSWAEQLIIALIIIIIIEIILPNGNNYKKYIKVVLGIFLVYTIINPIVGEKINNIKFKEVNTNIQNNINYDEQIEKKFKIKFEENINEFLSKNGYELEKIEQDVTYKNQEIEINKLKLKIEKQNQEKEKKKEKKQEKITDEEIKEIASKISDNYEIDESKIIIESENSND